MRRERWLELASVGLCGAVTGLIWYLMSAALLALFARDFLAAVNQTNPRPGPAGAILFAVDIAMGVWAVWLYSVLRRSLGTWRTAAVATGLAWWAMKSLESAKCVALGFIPVGVVVAPSITSLVCALLATALGTFVFEKVTLSGRSTSAAA